MKLSIITVNLNNHDGLKKTIDSVVSQTFRDFEWIVIDGGSTDGSRELLEEYSGHFAYWVSEPDKGIYNAMNKGVSHARGEYCQFLNSGDWLAGNDVLEMAAKKMNGCDVLYGDVDLYKNDNFFDSIKYSDYLSLDDMLYGMICHNSCYINTDLLRTTPYDENLTIVSDWKFFLQMMHRKESFAHIDKCIICYDMGGISGTQLEVLLKERKQTYIDLSYLIMPELLKVIDRTESHLAHLNLNEFNSICENHRALAKLITALLLPFKKK